MRLVPTSSVSKGFASRDQNSFRSPVATTMRAPDGSHKAAVKHDEGKSTGTRSRGVGRRISHDQNSFKSPVPTRMVARGSNGQFASPDSALQVFHPIGRKGGRKVGTSNKIEHYTSGSQVGVGVKKSLSLPGQGRRGRRIA